VDISREQDLLTVPSNIEYTKKGQVCVLLKGAKASKHFYPASGTTGCATGIACEELQAILVSLHITFLQFVEANECKRYKELWRMYMSEKHLQEACTLQHWWSQLQGWRTWSREAANRLHLQDMDLFMTNGPHTRMDAYNRADIGGVSFRASHLDDKWESKNSYFLQSSYDPAQCAQDFFVWVGRFQQFLEVVPPWQHSAAPSRTTMEFGVVKWCEVPLPAVLPLSDLPLIVKDEFLPPSHESAYKYAVWDLANVVPTNVAVVALDEHFHLRNIMHRGRTVSWRKLQVAIPSDWHWLPGYCCANGYCVAASEATLHDRDEHADGHEG
jgi:hypothetical protein